MIERLFLVGLHHRALVAGLVALLTLVGAAGLTRLQIDTGFENLIPDDDRDRMLYQRMLGEFGSDNRTIIYVADDDLWTPGKLAALDDLQRELMEIEQVARVDSLFSLRTVTGTPDGLDAAPLLEGVPESSSEALRIRARAMDNPLYLGNFFSEDGTITAIIVEAREVEDGRDLSLELYRSMQDVLDDHAGEFERLFQVGPPRISAELRQGLFSDFLLLGPLSALVLIAAILIFMRSPMAAALPLITSGLTIVWTFGMLGWVGIPLNILSAMIPSLIIVIGSTEDTHIIAAYFRGLLTGEPGDKTAAVRYMARHVGLPLLLTVFTTALGFASNLFSSIGLIQHFAVASTFAMVANGIITILLVPMLLLRFAMDAPPEPLAGGQEQGVPARIMRAFRVPQDRFPVNTLAVSGVACAFFVWQAMSLYVTNDPMSYFPENRPLIQDTRAIADDLAGVKLFFVTLESSDENAFLQPENVRKLSDIQAFIERQGAFDQSLSMADHLKFVNREFRGQFAELALPETRELVAQYLMFFHREDLSSYVSHDYRRANIVVRHAIDDSYTLNRYVDELRDVAAHIGEGLEVNVVGENLMVNRAAEDLLVAQVEALGLLLLLIFLLMSVMFTSFKGGLIAMVPAVLPIAVMFGAMGLLDIPLNPGTAMVAVIAIGIAIDGTIHLLARYNELCRRTSNYVAAVRQAAEEEATPLIVSSLALAFGFGIFLLSNFTVVAQFGALAASTMLFSIIANLLITPIIMARVRLVGLYQILSVKVDPRVLEDSPLFQSMSNYQRRKAVLISELHEYEDGELVVAQGDIGRSMYLILEGDAAVIRRDGDEQRVLAHLSPGQIFGEVGYIRAIERTADVRAIGPVSVLRFDYERMQKDLKYFPNIVAQLNFNISAILGGRLADVLSSERG